MSEAVGAALDVVERHGAGHAGAAAGVTAPSGRRGAAQGNCGADGGAVPRRHRHAFACLDGGGREVAGVKVDAGLGTAADLVRGQHEPQRQVLAPLLAGGGAAAAATRRRRARVADRRGDGGAVQGATVSWPLAFTTVSSIVAVAFDGFSPPKALAIIGEPSRASMTLNKTFCDSQPIVLNASVTPTAVLPELPPLPLPPPDEDDAVAALVVMAVSVAVFSASTVTPPPPAPVVVTWLLPRVALAALWTRLVPIRPSSASGDAVVEPAVVLGADEEPAVTSLVVVAVSVAISLACTSTLPPVVVSVVCVSETVAPPWTSLSDTAPATPVPLTAAVDELPVPWTWKMKLPIRTLLAAGAVEELPRVMVAVMAELSCAVTDTPPPAWMVEAGRLPVSKSMLAWALLLTLFVASTKPSRRFWPPSIPVFLPLPLPPLVGAVVVLLIVEVMVAPSRALTVSWPAVLTVVSSIVAVALDGFSPPKALASVGEPSRASMVLNRTFSDCQPMVLKASVTPTAVVPEPLPPLPLPLPLPDEDDAVAALVVMAVSVAVFSASTVTPPVPVVVTWLLPRLALAALWTRLVPIRPPTRSGELLVEPELAPLVEDIVAVNSLVVVAVSVDVSLA